MFISVLGIWLFTPLSEIRLREDESLVIVSEENEILWMNINAQGQYFYASDEIVPRKIKVCTLLYEDEYFYYHPGFNPVSLGKALAELLKKKRRRGGSTLSMQCARLYWNDPQRTLWQKIKEIMLAFKLEWKWGKENILKWYLNHAPYGKNFRGYATGAWAYFRKKPSELSWAEAATLAVIPQNPSGLYPGKNRKKLLEKRNFLLYKLYQKKILTFEEWCKALMEMPGNAVFPFPSDAMHFYDFLRKKGLHGKVKTALLYSLQKNIQHIVNSYCEKYALRDIHNMCALVVEADSAKVRAYVGNADHRNKTENYWNDHIQTFRSSGSTLKPFLYALALEKKIIYPDSWLPDIPEYFGTYDPGNASGSFDGVVPASEALARSLNVPFVELLRQTGIPLCLEKLKKCGFKNLNHSAEHYGLALILGGAEVSAANLATAYLNLLYASRNQKITLNEPMWHYQDNSFYFRKENSFDPGAAWFTITSMKEKYFSISQSTNGIPVFYKTGTSYGFRDAWAVGTNGRYVVAVWCGNSDGHGVPGLTGIDIAVPVLLKIFRQLNGMIIEKPRGFIKKTNVCLQSGYEAGPHCPSPKEQEIPRCAYASCPCSYHKIIITDPKREFSYHSDCRPESITLENALIFPPEQELYYKIKNPFYLPPPPLHPDCREAPYSQIQIVYPKNQLNIYLPKHEGKRSLILKAVTRNKKSTLKWFLNDELLGETSGIHQLEKSLAGGTYTLTLNDESGNSESITFRILSGFQGNQTH